MTEGRQVTRIATRSSFVPVLLPVFVLCIVAGAGRAVQEVRPLHRPLSAALTTSEANPTEATFLGYKRVEELLSGNESGALALLQTLAEAPLSVHGNTFHSKELAPFSPQGLLMGMVHSLAHKAVVAIDRGDIDTAFIYGESLRQIGDRLLLDSAPSVSAIQTAYRFHCAAARIQARLRGNAAEPMARHEETMLKAVWNARFAPLLNNHVPGNDARSEARFAAQIAREYREAWSRIRAGEA